MSNEQEPQQIKGIHIAQFCFKGAVGLLGALFVAYQFTFSNFAKVEIDAYKLKFEVEQARGQEYESFSDMKCYIEGFPSKKDSKVAKDDKSKTEEKNSDKTKAAEAEKPKTKSPAVPNDYAKCKLAHRMIEMTGGMTSLTESLGGLLKWSILVLGALGIGAFLSHLIELGGMKKEQNKVSASTSDNEPKTEQEQPKGATEGQQPEAPKASPEGTGSDKDKATQDKDK